MYKPRRQVRGKGVAQMSTLLYKSYLVKVSKNEGGSKGKGSNTQWREPGVNSNRDYKMSMLL